MCIQWLRLFGPSKFIVDSVSQKEHVHKYTFLNPYIYCLSNSFSRPKFVASDILVKMSAVSRYFIKRTARRNGILIESPWEQIRKFWTISEAADLLLVLSQIVKLCLLNEVQSTTRKK